MIRLIDLRARLSKLSLLWLFISSGTLLGCQAATNDYRYAIAPRMTATETDELKTVVAHALNQNDVSLNANVFANNPILILDHAVANTPQGRIATGRLDKPADTFHLLTDGSTCLLHQLSNDQHYPLKLNCVPIATTALRSTDHWIPSRDTQIPVTLVAPTEYFNSTQPIPFVVLLHGHGGTRDEAGGFTRVAAGLAAQGIASIRMDFPGCGDSRESFANNNLTNMLADAEASLDFAASQLNIDTQRLGVLGFSMGGRLAMILSGQGRPFQAMGLWAPAATPGAANMQKYLGGKAQYEQKKTLAKTAGFAPFTTAWGQAQKLGYQWFVDLEQSTPLDYVAKFPGALMVLYGDQDTVVLPEISERVLTAAQKSQNIVRHVVVGADHGLGLFGNNTQHSEEAVQSTVEFFAQQFNVNQ